MKNKEYFSKPTSFVERYQSNALGSAIIQLLGGGKLLIRKPDDLKKMYSDVTDLPEGMPFTGGGVVSIKDSISDGGQVFVYVNDLNQRLVELFGIGLVVEGNFTKICKRVDWEADNIYRSHLIRYPRAVDAAYMYLLSGEKLRGHTRTIYRAHPDDLENKVTTEETLCVTYDGWHIRVDDLIACAQWMGDVFNYDVASKTVTIKPRPEPAEEEEEE